ncbi:type VI secretion system contractile sheath small subunit [Desulfococcaceae bacterium HSG7]|nr:type VI secretion system contractile sheath small subunit [Desulfococcaceae bacterium HSG7]
MASQGTVPPKERVNIVYKPATDGVQEEIELPLKILVMGDFTLKQDDTPIEERKVVNIDKDNFNKVLEDFELSVDLNPPNTLSDDPEAQMSVNLDFKTLADFKPKAIVDKIPELKKLLELRTMLASLKGPLGNTPAFRQKLQDIVQDEDVRERLLKELGL